APRPDLYTLSLHDALPICLVHARPSVNAQRAETEARAAWTQSCLGPCGSARASVPAEYQDLDSRDPRWANANARRCREKQNTPRSEEHTSELQSRENLVCR